MMGEPKIKLCLMGRLNEDEEEKKKKTFVPTWAQIDSDQTNCKPS